MSLIVLKKGEAEYFATFLRQEAQSEDAMARMMEELPDNPANRVAVRRKRNVAAALTIAAAYLTSWEEVADGKT